MERIERTIGENLMKEMILMDYIANPKRLRAKMDEHGFTNAKLAEAAGVSERTIKRLLHGATSTVTTLSYIATALDVPLVWLVCKDDPPDETNEPEIISEPHDCPNKQSVDRLEQSYNAQINDLKQRIEAIRELYFRERKEKHRLMVFTVFLIVFVCFWLTVDIMNPSVGWLKK